MRKLKRILLPLLIALGLIVTAQVVLAAVVWGTNHLNLSRASTNAAYPAVAVSNDGQNIGFVWSQGIAGTTAARGPVYLKAANDGYTISVRTAVDFANSSTNQSLTPDVASDPQNGDYMYVVWKNIEDDDNTVFVKRCATTGGCSGEVAIESVTAATGDVNYPRIATSKQSVGTVVHLAWQSIVYGTPDTKVIKYASGYWNGTTWTWLQGPTTVSGSGRWASHPAIAVSTDTSGNGTNVHVAWADDENEDTVNGFIGYRRQPLNLNGSPNGAWGTIQYHLANDPPFIYGANPDYPALAAFKGTVMLLWDEYWSNSLANESEYYLAYAVSADHGTSFVTDVLRDSGSNPAIYLSDHQRNLPGTGFTEESPAERLQVDAAAELTSTATITGLFHIVWHSNEDNTDPLQPYHDIFYNRWCGGTTCGADSGWKYYDGSNETDGLKYNGPYQTQDAPFYSMSADIAAASGNKVYVVYMEGDDTADSEPSLDNTHFDVIYNGTVRLTDTTKLSDGGVYLPIIMKNAS